MTPRDVALASAVALVWGLAFIASKLALREVSPLVLTDGTPYEVVNVSSGP